MTLLHQAAQKAVEAKQREAFEHWYSDAGRWPKSVARGEDGHYLLAQTNSSYEAWRAAAAALQQQPEPVAPNEWAAEAATVMAQFIHLSAQPERDAWAQNASRAIRLLNAPALQHQEVPREPVAHYEQMRLTLIGQVHELLDIAERHAWTKDPEEKRRTEGAIAHAQKVTAPYNYNGAASPSTTRQQEVGSDIVEAIARQWDGCMVPMFDAAGNPTDAIDIGATIRADGIPAAAPSPLQREVGSEYEFAGGFIQNRNANGSTRWEQVSKQYENDADVVKLYLAAAPSTPEKAGGVSDGVGGQPE